MNVNAPPVTLVKIRANFIDDTDEIDDDSDSGLVAKKPQTELEQINRVISQHLGQLLSKYREMISKRLEHFTANMRFDGNHARTQAVKVLSEQGMWVDTPIERVIEFVQTTVSSAFQSELQRMHNKLQSHFTAKRAPDSCFQLLDSLSQEHTNKFKEIINNKTIKTNVLAAIGRVTTEACKEQRISTDVFVADKVLYRVKANCFIEPVISSEHRRYFETNSMRGTIPVNGLKPNSNEPLRVIANAILCNRRPRQQSVFMWIVGENSQSFASNFQTIAGGYTMYVSKTDTKIKPGVGTRVAIMENSKALLTKLNRLPSAVFPLVVSAPNDLTPPECRHDWVVLKYTPPAGLTPEQLFFDLIQAANPSVTDPISSWNTTEQLSNDALETVVKEFLTKNTWKPLSKSGNDHKKTVAIKDIKMELANMAAKQGIKTLTLKTIANAFQANGFSITNPRNIISISCVIDH